MIYSQKIQEAIKLAIKTHEIDQKQKRKGKDIPYLTHPLTVGIILAKAQCNEETIIAGILHDTMEDSTSEAKITSEILEEKFNKNVSTLVLSVTENEKNLDWDDRKKEALNHIKSFSHDSILIKSADIISNVSEIEDDFNKDGNNIFERFAVVKEKTLNNYKNVTEELLKNWEENPLADDLKNILQKINILNNK